MSPSSEPMNENLGSNGSAHKEPPKTLEAHLSGAQARYIERNPKSRINHEESCQYLPGGNTRTVIYSSPFPLTFASASGCTLTTLDGHTYTDFLGEYTAGIFGHSNPLIKNAIQDALFQGWSFGGTNVYEKELAKAICARFAPTMEMVRFTNSGTEANMIAIAAAMAFTNRKKILVFRKGYHGSTISARGSSGAGTRTINLPHDFVIAPYNDIPATREKIASIPPDSLAGILVEPLLGSGGCFPGSKEFLQYLRDAATATSAVLIFDEVMTSRLSYGGKQEQLGIHPDLMTLGKWVAGSMSFGAFGGRRDIMEMFDPRKEQLEHAGTFNNNVVSMAAGVAGNKILTDAVLRDLNERGDYMRREVEYMLEDHDVVTAKHAIPRAPEFPSGHTEASVPSKTPTMYITGEGSLMTIHFSGANQASLQALFWHHMLEYHNIYLAQRGFIAMSIEIGEPQAAEFLAGVDSFVAKYKPWLI
jgi:glutamate-1-semialdehyde 2,1-aminomutase